MSKLPLLVGGGALAWYAWRRRTAHQSTGALPGRWVWPVPRLNGRAPVISDGFGSPRPGGIRHGGVDVMFARVAGDPYKPGTPNGSAHHVMPDGVAALAASDGIVWSALRTARGFAVVVDHGRARTFYTHLEKLLVTPTANAKSGERVRAGQPIGIIGADPLDAAHLKHLHFEIWLGPPTSVIDPAPLMRAWPMLAVASSPAARNAALLYRRVGASGERYPQWVRDLDGKSGVYIIRDADTHEILYVGSSSTRLYDTLTRHFQQWRRYKGFWRGQYGEGHDPGLTYKRDRVEVAIRLTSPSAALDEEMRTIARLAPRDNLIGQTASAEDEVPF